MVDNSSHSHFTISKDGKELFLNHLKVDLPFNSGNHECSNFKTLPSHLHFHIALEDSEKNRVVYKYHYPIWANHFMGSYQMAMSRLGWEPIRIAVIGNPKWGKSTFVNELGDFTSIDDHRIQLVSDVGLGVQNDHATRMVRRFCLWQEGKFAKLPLSVCVQDPPGSNVGVMDKVPQYIEYLVKQKITPDEDIITECTLNPHSCLKKYEHHPEQLPDVIVYMIPFGMIEKSKESITPNLQYFHKLQIPVILVVTTGEERKLSVIHDEINKLQGYNYHSVVISNEHYELNAPKSPEVIRRVAQILREVFDLVQSKRGVLQTWKVIVKKVFSEVWNQYGMIMLTMTMANVMWLFMLILL
ncbi:hypothetical protein C9374_006042 [Naegleria lovaniensis]|uniref:Uncharacterized protein n=1 Tax=Naegleria lovaniensis TaxID=51637 RepID=A0AA88GP81_NAELO|nr:uncharacterized protein C9374_006042 [Naegleria lovaniensis]KAG2381658.1 hypothetical protein C9374_006042 [Naegleria lovaniensis]